MRRRAALVGAIVVTAAVLIAGYSAMSGAAGPGSPETRKESIETKRIQTAVTPKDNQNLNLDICLDPPGPLFSSNESYWTVTKFSLEPAYIEICLTGKIRDGVHCEGYINNIGMSIYKGSMFGLDATANNDVNCTCGVGLSGQKFVCNSIWPASSIPDINPRVEIKSNAYPTAADQNLICGTSIRMDIPESSGNDANRNCVADRSE